MAPLCNWSKRGAVRVSDSALGVGLKARPDRSAVEHLTYKVEGREFEPRSGRLFSRTLY